MVRTYKPKTNRKPVSPNKLKRAADLVHNGWAIRAAARQECINRQALWSFLKKNRPTDADATSVHIDSFKLSHASRGIFNEEQGDKLVKYCLEVAKMGCGLTVTNVRELAYEVAHENNLPVPENWNRDKLADIDWFQGFKNRHSSQLSIRTPEACSIARAMAFNEPNVEQYFDKLEEVLSRHPTFQDGSRVYNLDETSTSTIQIVNKIVSPKVVKQVHQIKTAERGTTINLLIA